MAPTSNVVAQIGLPENEVVSRRGSKGYRKGQRALEPQGECERGNRWAVGPRQCCGSKRRPDYVWYNKQLPEHKQGYGPCVSGIFLTGTDADDANALLSACRFRVGMVRVLRMMRVWMSRRGRDV